MYKGLELDLLHEEVEELRQEVARLQVKEDNLEQEVRRHRRQVDLFSRPEVLDYAYNSRMPDSSSELSVYDKWFTGKENNKEGETCLFTKLKCQIVAVQSKILNELNSTSNSRHSLLCWLGRFWEIGSMRA